jgi:hypothetical protein
MSRADVNEITRHIDHRFADLKRDMEWKAQRERFRIEAKRDTIFWSLGTAVILTASVYNNWDFCGSLFGA